MPLTTLKKINLIILLTLCTLQAQAILIKHENEDDRLPVFVYKTDANGGCSFASGEIYIDDAVMSKAGSAPEKWSSFRLPIGEDYPKKFCIRAQYQTTDNDAQCWLGPINNDSRCVITFGKTGGNKRTPSIIEKYSTFAYCGINESSSLVPFKEGARPPKGKCITECTEYTNGETKNCNDVIK